MSLIETLAKNVRESSLKLQSLTSQQKNEILTHVKRGLLNAANVAKEANEKDMDVHSLPRA